MSEREIPDIFHEVGPATNPSDRNTPSTERDNFDRLVKPTEFEQREHLQGNERWRLGEVIGEGNFGVVYKAHDEKLDLDVAVKVFYPKDINLKDQTWETLAERDALYMAAVNHPNVPRVYEFGMEKSAEGGKIPFMVTELLDKEDYRDLSEKAGLLKPTEVVGIVEEIGGLVDFMASKGIYHHDLKPNNIKIPRVGTPNYEFNRLKVLDFGLANLEGISGSPDYIAPEVIESNGEVRDLRSEVYALGTMTYELLVGGLPPRAVSLESQLQFDQQSLKYLQLCKESSREEFDFEEVHTILKKSMSIDPENRYQTCTEFLSDLKAAIGKQSTETPIFAGI